MTSTKPHPAIWFAMLVCAALCLYSISFRFKVESRNRAVSIVAEADQIESLAASQGMNFELALGNFKAGGLTGIVVTEDTIGDLVSGGAVQFDQSELPKSRSPIVKISGRAENVARVERGLRNRFDLKASQLGVKILESPGATRIELTILNLSPTLIRSTSIGLDPQYATAATLTNLDVVARFGNPTGASDRYVQETIRWSREDGARYFLPSGDQVLGRRDSLAVLIDELDRNQILYCSPEFAKIGGDSNVLAKRPQFVVRLHAAQSVEVDKLTPGGYVERYALAASERNIRVLLLRPLTLSSERPLDAFIDLTSKVKRQLEREGSEIRTAHPFEDSVVPNWLFAAIGLSIAPIATFVMATVFAGRRNWIWISALFFALLGAACYVEPARNYAALIGSLAFPIAAFLVSTSLPRNILIRFVLISVISTIGGLVVAGLLNGLPYFIRADQFSGVKISVFLPIGVIAFYFFLKLTDAKNAYRSPILWSQAILGIVILALLGFMASRTGNDNPAGVSGVELQLRSLLERWLVVRPRTKEFLIGHPALIVGLGMLAQCVRSESFRSKWGGWTALALLAAGIGQTSLVNTMCHLHTPVAIGLTRIAIGMALGGVIGIALWQGLKMTLLRKDLAELEATHG